MEKVKFNKHRTHQKYVTTDGTVVPGASTVAKVGSDSSALLHWAWQCGVDGLDYRKVRDTAADIGTLCHFMIECHLTGKEPDLDAFSADDIKRAKVSFDKFREFWEREELKIINPETVLVSDKYRYGGTLDAPCTNKNGDIILVDWKTSKAIYDEYLYQLAGYENLWNEDGGEFGQTKINRRVIVRIGKKDEGDFEVRWLSDLKNEFEIFKAQLNLYWAKRNAGKK
jgi:hypothetical protein